MPKIYENGPFKFKSGAMRAGKDARGEELDLILRYGEKADGWYYALHRPYPHPRAPFEVRGTVTGRVISSAPPLHEIKKEKK